MATKYLIDRYTTNAAKRIQIIDALSEDEYTITDAAGREYRKLGDCFDSFEKAKDEWIKRCCRALESAEDEVDRAEEAYAEAMGLEEPKVTL